MNSNICRLLYLYIFFVLISAYSASAQTQTQDKLQPSTSGIERITKPLPAVATYTSQQWIERIIRLIEEPFPTPEAFAEEMGVTWEKEIEAKDWNGKSIGMLWYKADIPWDYPINPASKQYRTNFYKKIYFERYEKKDVIILSFQSDKYFCIREKKIFDYITNNNFKKIVFYNGGHNAPSITYEKNKIRFSYSTIESCINSIGINKSK